MNSKLLLLLTVTNTFFCNCLQTLSPNSGKEFEGIKIFSFGNNRRPSPINLERSSMITKRSWTPLHFSSEHSLTKEFKKTVRAEGLDVTFDFGDEKPTVSGGIHSGFTYEFDKLFFHWDNDNKREEGSYHTVDGKYFPMELQAYYTLIPPLIFGELLPAILRKEIQRTLIISQFLELNNTTNAAIKTLLTGKKISIDKLIQPFREYAAYKGSFVIQPYTEDVKWIISLKPQQITKTQLNEFRKLQMIEPAREIQPLYGRRVFYVRPWEK